MKVTDNVTVKVRTNTKTKEVPIEFTLMIGDNRVAMEVRDRGFKQAAIVNNAQIERYGMYEMALQFIEYFFANIMLMGPCEVNVVNEGWR